jgi:hypothetical protein
MSHFINQLGEEVLAPLFVFKRNAYFQAAREGQLSPAKPENPKQMKEFLRVSKPFTAH